MTKDTDTGLPAASLGAGSYDYDKLYGDKASELAKLPEGERQAAMDDHVRAADVAKVDEFDPRDVPGYKWKNVTRDGVTERIQVPDEAYLAAQEPTAEEATPAAKTSSSVQPASPGAEKTKGN